MENKSFDVMKEPWIPVIGSDGAQYELSILDLLRKAPELQGIHIASPLEEFGVYRFLSTLLMDALRPNTQEDIQAVLRRGSFDMNQINRYLRLCESTGLTFDILNSSRPLLQPPYNKLWDGDTDSVTRMDFAFPSGNNHIHFEHRRAESMCYSYAESFRKLLVCYSFMTVGGAGYPASINGNSQYYLLINGANLFQTLCLMMVPLKDYAHVESQPGIGRMDDIQPSAEVGGTDPETGLERPVGFFRAMLYPSRRIRLIPDPYKDGITRIHFHPGLKYAGGEEWTDPSVLYAWTAPDKNGEVRRFPVRPSMDAPDWQTYISVIRNNRSSVVLSQYLALDPDWEQASVTLYGMQADKAKIICLLRQEFRIPRLILSNPEKFELANECMLYCDSVRFRLGKGLRIALQKEDPQARPSEMKRINAVVQSAMTLFLTRSEPLFLDMIDLVSLSPLSEKDAILAKWKKDIFGVAKQIFEDTTGGFGSNGPALRRIALGRQNLYGRAASK